MLDGDHVALHFLSTRPWPPVGINIDFQLFYEARESSVGTSYLILFWYLHADTDDLATRSGQNLKSPGFIQKIHSYWCLSSKWFSEIILSSRNHNVCQSWVCEMGTDSKRPFENCGGGGFSIASDFFVSILRYG